METRTEGDIRRDLGIKIVIRNESDKWKAAYYEIAQEYFFGVLKIGDKFKFEDINEIARYELGEPHHENCFGGLCARLKTRLLKNELIAEVGFEKSAIPTNNSSRIATYLKVK